MDQQLVIPVATTGVNAVPHKFRGPITLQEISAYFNMPIKEAAQKLNICVTNLKIACRQLGIGRWPYRKLKGLSVKDPKDSALSPSAVKVPSSRTKQASGNNSASTASTGAGVSLSTPPITSGALAGVPQRIVDASASMLALIHAAIASSPTPTPSATTSTTTTTTTTTTAAATSTPSATAAPPKAATGSPALPTSTEGDRSASPAGGTSSRRLLISPLVPAAVPGGARFTAPVAVDMQQLAVQQQAAIAQLQQQQQQQQQASPATPVPAPAATTTTTTTAATPSTPQQQQQQQPSTAGRLFSSPTAFPTSPALTSNGASAATSSQSGSFAGSYTHTAIMSPPNSLNALASRSFAVLSPAAPPAGPGSAIKLPQTKFELPPLEAMETPVLAPPLILTKLDEPLPSLELPASATPATTATTTTTTTTTTATTAAAAAAAMEGPSQADLDLLHESDDDRQSSHSRASKRSKKA